MSQVVQMPKDFDGTLFELGEPLLFKAAAWLTFGSVPDGYTVSMHPVAFAAWFGMLATTLNLFPVGQTDGGHICYCGARPPQHDGQLPDDRVPRRAVVLLHVLDSVDGADDRDARRLRAATSVAHSTSTCPLDPTRMWVAAFGVVVFVVCFAPVPLQIVDLCRRQVTRA